jgi:hypothetical protein
MREKMLPDVLPELLAFHKFSLKKSPESSKTHGGFWKCFGYIKNLRNNATP